MLCTQSLFALTIPVAFVIPTKEGSHLIAIMLYENSLSFPLFALMQKVEQKNQGCRNRSACLSTHAQQHSNTLIVLNQLYFHNSVPKPYE
jgi:hypothetical protein